LFASRHSLLVADSETGVFMVVQGNTKEINVVALVGCDLQMSQEKQMIFQDFLNFLCETRGKIKRLR